MSGPPRMSPALGHPPCESWVAIQRPDGGPLVRGRLKTVRRVQGGRAVWAVRVPVDGHRHPEGELVTLTVEVGADGVAWAVTGETLSHAVRVAEHVVAGREVRDPVTVQLMSLSASLLALLEGGP